jgi:hypothetical protein
MSRYRPFWNKIWEAPTLDAVNRAGGRPKSLWELDVNTRYLVLLTPHEQANGLIETRLNAAPSDPDEIRVTTSGRLKGGIEVSFEEVNKLAELFGVQPLDGDRLAALRAHAVAYAESGEFIAAINLKGRANERGMVWVVPVFRLGEFTLSAVQKIDESGQVLSVADETVRYPVRWPRASSACTRKPATRQAGTRPTSFTSSTAMRSTFRKKSRSPRSPIAAATSPPRERATPEPVRRWAAAGRP